MEIAQRSELKTQQVQMPSNLEICYQYPSHKLNIKISIQALTEAAVAVNNVR